MEDTAYRRRAMAAVVLIGVGWTVGFFAGRMSAWIFPVLERETATVSSATSASTQPPEAPQREMALTGAAPAATEGLGANKTSPGPSQAEEVRASAKAPEPARDAANPAPTPVVNSEPARPIDGPENDRSQTSDGGPVLLNPDWKRAKSQRELAREAETERAANEREPEDERVARDRDGDWDEESDRGPSEAALAKCERRYNSFRRSDGTFQPYNSRSRELCPFLHGSYGSLR